VSDVARRDLAGFTGAGYDKGRSGIVQVLWLFLSGILTTRWWCPMRVRHRVRIHWPWKLTVGDHSWIGEDVWILNLEPVRIGSNVCVSQGVLLCTGSHDRHSPTFEYDNAPILVEDGAWVAARATVLRGVTIGADATVGACALVTRDVAPGATVLAPAATTREP